VHDPDLLLDLCSGRPARVELAVDDSERQLLTPLLRHFIGLGYRPDRTVSGDHLRLTSDDGFVTVQSDLDERGVVLSIAASALDQQALHTAVASAITYDGLLWAEHDEAHPDHRRFNDRTGVARAVLRSCPA
jgi:post-segregation antitoxin (ccd killing protein)